MFLCFKFNSFLLWQSVTWNESTCDLGSWPFSITRWRLCITKKEVVYWKKEGCVLKKLRLCIRAKNKLRQRQKRDNRFQRNSVSKTGSRTHPVTINRTIPSCTQQNTSGSHVIQIPWIHPRFKHEYECSMWPVNTKKSNFHIKSPLIHTHTQETRVNYVPTTNHTTYLETHCTHACSHK